MMIQEKVSWTQTIVGLPWKLDPILLIDLSQVRSNFR
jgi:hypothetical protein